jgi:hypothetical protein
MQPNMRLCFRCSGRKKMYKGSGESYSLANFGGTLVDCPLCLGKGEIKTLDAVAEEAEKKKKLSGSIKKEDVNGVNSSI